MFWVLVLLSFIVLIGDGMISEGAGLRPRYVDVGAIFSLGTLQGEVTNIAMKAAEEDVNSDPSFLGGSKLRITTYDAKRNGFLTIMGALQFMETDAVAIIGPQTSIMAHVLSHLANELSVPMLSFTALDPSLSALQFPFFVQTAPSDLFLMRAIAEMISYYGWSEVIALYNDDDNSRNGITALGDELEGRRCKISYKAVLPLDVVISSPREIINELVKIQGMESRVIIVNTFPKTGKKIFEEAQKLGMMEKGYVWIATTWLTSLLDSVNPLPAKTAESLRGVLTLRIHTPNSKKKKDFVARWNKLSNGTVGLNVYGLYAYDTVWIIARAVKRLLDSRANISFSSDPKLTSMKGGGSLNLGALSIFDQGSQFLDYIVNTNMTGVTGQIQFLPDRSMIQPSYDIINVVDDGFRQIGYWSNHSGLSIIPPESLYKKLSNRSSSNQHLNNVTWPGGTSETPRGWVFPNNGRRLRIGVPDRASFKEFVSRLDGSNKVQGYAIDVFEAAVKLISYPVPHEFVLFGDGLKNPNFNEFVNNVTIGVFDAVVGDIAIVTKRTRIVDFTQPYIESGLVVVAPVTKLNDTPWAFLRPFTPPMWAVTAAFFLIVGSVIWILEHRINDEFRGPPRKQIVTILWFSFSTMFFSHRENTVSTLGRAVLLIWLFVVLIITSSYTASLTSILTVQQLNSPIRGVDTLISSSGRVGFQVGSYAENYMIDELNIARSRLVPLGSPKEYAAALQNGTVAAIVDERPYVDLFLSEFCGFAIRGQEFTRSGWGFAFPRDSPLAIDMSTAILGLSETGQLQKIHDKWLSRSNCSNLNGSVSDEDSEQLKLRSFWGLFLVCGISCFIALFIYFFKIVRDFFRHGKYDEEATVPSPESSRSKSLQTFLAYFDEKEDESKRRMKRKRNDDLSLKPSRPI
ncbi:unnamed protein product [Arabidopsis thaliana]|uniref:Glutamate receptor n=1 Tax=Arabidopsis thaliana TaxID=3702 RepID=A0A7G2F3E4_ARATH|nr:unnamed protein product [Arabidopsis thaliana]